MLGYQTTGNSLYMKSSNQWSKSIINCKYAYSIHTFISFLTMYICKTLVKWFQRWMGYLYPHYLVILSYTIHWWCPIHVTKITGHHSGSGKGIQSPDTCTTAHLNYLIYIPDSKDLIPITQDIMAMWSNNELSFSGKFIYQLGQWRSIHGIQHLK